MQPPMRVGCVRCVRCVCVCVRGCVFTFFCCQGPLHTCSLKCNTYIVFLFFSSSIPNFSMCVCGGGAVWERAFPSPESVGSFGGRSKRETTTTKKQNETKKKRKKTTPVGRRRSLFSTVTTSSTDLLFRWPFRTLDGWKRREKCGRNQKEFHRPSLD